MKTIILGSNGQLGQTIRSLGVDALYCNKDQCDISSPKEVQTILSEFSPDIIINCSAYTNVDESENNKKHANLINNKSLKSLVEYCNSNNSLLIHISTDYVFDGQSNISYKESHQTSPINYYGETKRDGENLIINNCDKYYIIRTSWLYSEFGHNFVKTMKRLLLEKENISVINDQIGSPTYTRDLVEAIVSLSNDSKDYGIYHFSNDGEISWFEFASEIKRIINSECEITPISSSEYKTTAKRPKYSLLNTDKIKQTLNIEIPFWKESLETCLKNLS